MGWAKYMEDDMDAIYERLELKEQTYKENRNAETAEETEEP